MSVGSNSSQNNNASNSTLETSNLPENGNAESPTGGSSVKPKKLLPWMAELKQKQDKKQALNSTNNSPNSTAVNNLSASSSGLSTPQPSDTAAKAPPLPAKPSSLATNANPSIDKSPSVSPSTIPSSQSSGLMNRIKKPAPGHLGGNSNHNHTTVFSNNESGIGGAGDSRSYVSFEEYAKLRDRVIVLESELETVRRQVKLLLDRELNQGHIV